MQRVLIPIDYHPVSEEIAETGFELAQKLHAEACLLHVVESAQYYRMDYPAFLGGSGYGAAGLNWELDSEIQHVAEDFLAKAAAHLSGKVSTHIERGPAANAILDYAQDWNADIIVMGTHSHSVLEKLFMGSQAAAILEKTKIPIFMVPVKK